MGCGETLFLGSGGHVTCSFVDCPDPSAADTVLHERETEHVVVFTDEHFTIQHPLKDRLQGVTLAEFVDLIEQGGGRVYQTDAVAIEGTRS
jgi:hypothetical protein